MLSTVDRRRSLVYHTAVDSVQCDGRERARRAGSFVSAATCYQHCGERSDIRIDLAKLPTIGISRRHGWISHTAQRTFDIAKHRRLLIDDEALSAYQRYFYTAGTPRRLTSHCWFLPSRAAVVQIRWTQNNWNRKPYRDGRRYVARDLEL